MSYGDTSHDSADESGGAVAKLSKRVRKSAGSGTLAGLGGGLTVLRGLRSIRAGDRARGLRRLVVGGGLLAIAVRQRRSKREAGEPIDIDPSDVVDTSPDIESVADERDDQQDHAGGEQAEAVVDTGPEITDAVDEAETEADGEAESETADEGEREGATGQTAESTDTEASQSESETDESETDGSGPSEGAAGGTTAADRLGAAAFDEHSNEVPAPQRAFNQRFLSLDAEAVWGVRDDDVVVVSQQYDPIEEDDTIEYVASTRVDEDRVLTVPDEILDHWDEVAGGGVAVEGGDDIVFATSDDPEADWQLLVVPAAWADDVLGEGA